MLSKIKKMVETAKEKFSEAVGKIKNERVRKFIRSTLWTAQYLALAVLVIVGFKSMLMVIPSILISLMCAAGLLMLYYWFIFGVKESPTL
jgi:hypothetical protein